MTYPLEAVDRTPVYNLPFLAVGAPATYTRAILEDVAFETERVLSRAGLPSGDTGGGATDFLNRYAVSVMDRGAVGDGTADDTAAFRDAFGGPGRRIYIPAGRYLIRGHVRWYRDTEVLCHPAAVILNDSQDSETIFVNGEFENTTYATGYAGDGNLRWIGGTIDCAPRRARSAVCQGFAVGHADGVLFAHMTLRNSYAGHLIEINSSRNVRFHRVTFADQDTGGQTNREAVNIDQAYAGGFPALGAYDGTNCESIVFDQCVFDNTADGAGTHFEAPHRNVWFLDCTWRNVKHRPVHGRGWIGGGIRGGRIVDAGQQAIQLTTCTDFTIEDLEVEGAGVSADATYAAILIDGSNPGTRIQVSRTVRIKPSAASANRYTYAVDVQTGTGHRVDTPRLTAGSAGLVNDPAGLQTVLDGTTVLVLADDAVGSVAGPVNGHATVAISTNATTGFAVRGLYWARVTGTPVLQAISAVAATDVILTTGITTVAAATDVKVTVSAGTDGRLYIINRSGSARRFAVQFLAGG